MFGDVVGGTEILNATGQVAATCWLEIPRHFPNVTLDDFIVMPDHLHGILAIHEVGDALDVGAQHRVGAQHAAPLPLRRQASGSGHTSGGAAPTGVIPGSLGAIVRSFKSATTRRINDIRRTPGGSVWQRNYYDRIIRDDHELYRARRYIRSNPARWTGRVGL
jgi:putative transposase